MLEKMKTQLKVLALLLLLLAGLGLYALPSLRDEAASLLHGPDTARPATAQARPAAPVPTDTAAQRILLIGDSMLEGIARRFSAWCEAGGHELYTVIWYGSTTKNWAESGRMKHYVEQTRPTLVVVSLGSNELFVKDAARRGDYVRTLTAAFGATPYVWIGPPNWKEDTGINAAIAKETGRERFFESRLLTLARSSDGRHPTTAAAAAWTDSVAAWMASPRTAHPIRLAPPTAQQGRWNKRLTLIPQE